MRSEKHNINLLLALTSRELRGRFRGSYLGWTWALARPLVMLLVYGLIVGAFLGAAKTIPEFMVFIFVGLIAWNLFAAIVTSSIASITQGATLISRSSFPRILLPLSSAAVAIVDSLIQGAVLILAYVIVSDWPSIQSLAYLLPSALGVIMFGLGMGLLLAALNVYVRDVSYLTEIALQVGFWICPILYSYGFIVSAAQTYNWSVEWVTRIYMLNPMANGVVGFQRALWPPASTSVGADFSFPGQLEVRLIFFFFFSATFLGIAAVIFNRLSRNFAQEL